MFWKLHSFYNVPNKGMTSMIPSLVRIWKICHLYPGCSFRWNLRVAYFTVKHSYLCIKNNYYKTIITKQLLQLLFYLALFLFVSVVSKQIWAALEAIQYLKAARLYLFSHHIVSILHLEGGHSGAAPKVLVSALNVQLIQTYTARLDPIDIWCGSWTLLHVGLNIWSLSSCGKKISLARCTHSWNIFSFQR